MQDIIEELKSEHRNEDILNYMRANQIEAPTGKQPKGS